MWSFNLRWCLILTPSNLKVETCSNWWFPKQKDWIILLGYFMKFISISLHFSGSYAQYKNYVTLTAKFKMLRELCSIIYTLIFHSLNSLFIIIENRVMLILVPWGMPPWVHLHSDKVLSIHTAWFLLVRKDYPIR